MSAVIVLNTDNTALHTVSVQHAIRMLVREVAIVEEARDGHRIGPYPWPLVLRLIRYVKTTFLYARTPAWSKRGVLRRDHHRCAYCQGPADTVDHLLPQSRGGTNSWKKHRRCLHSLQQPQGQSHPHRGRHVSRLEAQRAELA